MSGLSKKLDFLSKTKETLGNCSGHSVYLVYCCLGLVVCSGAGAYQWGIGGVKFSWIIKLYFFVVKNPRFIPKRNYNL